ncbi:uncharacterized protein EV420DRAFT_1638603 [Desarmillaria tabescens]|uniref:Uncharacterized protein n=1 Tax=Armillaria tabescens TaxID=1929756 RepID=A0AA39TU91_ARMTA|nr:uncharacterized protein EV420DRAFT_1638603 [Desarmillaria tabescens]KAK0463679.1 hypothetical protein EV420DRAFT_1638603 [Desarmillaria tabescens]
MANLTVSAKSGSAWGRNELLYFKIQIDGVDVPGFFSVAQLPGPNVPTVILSHVDRPSAPLFHDTRLFFAYLDDAMTAFDEPDGVIHCRKELSFEMRTVNIVNPEPQLIAEAIAAFHQNNLSRIAARPAPLQQEINPGITMRGSTPMFFKIPIMQCLIDNIVSGVHPQQPTIVQRCVQGVLGGGFYSSSTHSAHARCQ